MTEFQLTNYEKYDEIVSHLSSIDSRLTLNCAAQEDATDSQELETEAVTGDACPAEAAQDVEIENANTKNAEEAKKTSPFLKN